jgi:hypothetical protein
MLYNRTFIFAIAVVFLDAFCVFIHLLDLLLAGNGNYVGIASVFDSFVAVPVIIVNLVYLVGSVCLGKGKYAGIIGMFVVFSVICCCWLHGLSLDRHDRWFIRYGVKTYSNCVNDIKLKKDSLYLVNHNVDGLLNATNVVRGDVFASTNVNGSLFIVFDNRDGLWNSGYVFYDGTNVSIRSDANWTINNKWGPYKLIYGPWYEF